MYNKVDLQFCSASSTTTNSVFCFSRSSLRVACMLFLTATSTPPPIFPTLSRRKMEKPGNSSLLKTVAFSHVSQIHTMSYVALYTRCCRRVILHCFDVQSVFDGTNAFKLLALRYNTFNASV